MNPDIDTPDAIFSHEIHELGLLFSAVASSRPSSRQSSSHLESFLGVLLQELSTGLMMQFNHSQARLQINFQGAFLKHLNLRDSKAKSPSHLYLYKGITTSSKRLLIAKGIATRNKCISTSSKKLLVS